MSAAARYSRAMQWFHWGMFVLVVAAYFFANLHGWLPRGSAGRANALGAHFLAGIAVFVLVWPRLWRRRREGVPPIQPPLAAWSKALAGITHAALYLFLIVQPILGFATAQHLGKPIELFGATIIPQIATVDRDFGRKLEDIHVLVATIFYFVIGLHVLAAIWHHYVTRDNVLQRMLPPRGDAR